MGKGTAAKTSEDPAGTKVGSNVDEGNTTKSRGGNNTQRNMNSVVNPSNPADYEGECKKVGAILGLRSERLHKKVSYEQFIEKLCNYIVQAYADGADIKVLLMKGRDPIEAYEDKLMPSPLSNEDKDDPVKDAILKEEIKQFVARKNNIRRNIQSAFSLIWGQCSSALQAYVKGLDGYEEATEDYDVTWLLREIKKACSGIDSKANPYITLHDAIGLLYRMRQGQTEPDDSYVERFKNNVATVEMVQGSNLFYSPGIVGKSYSLATKQEIYNAKEANLAALMLINAEPGRYRDLASNLKKGANLGRDEYSKSIARMYELMMKYTRDSSKIANRGGRKGSVFVQTGSSEGDNEQDPIPGNDGVTHPKIVCFNCGQYRHYSSGCPSGNKKKNGASALMNGTCLRTIMTRSMRASNEMKILCLKPQ